MKTFLTLLALTLTLAGCAREEDTVTAISRREPTSSYTRKDLERTGEPSNAEALRKSDPAVTIARGR